MLRKLAPPLCRQSSTVAYSQWRWRARQIKKVSAVHRSQQGASINIMPAGIYSRASAHDKLECVHRHIPRLPPLGLPTRPHSRSTFTCMRRQPGARPTATSRMRRLGSRPAQASESNIFNLTQDLLHRWLHRVKVLKNEKLLTDGAKKPTVED